MFEYTCITFNAAFLGHPLTTNLQLSRNTQQEQQQLHKMRTVLRGIWGGGGGGDPFTVFLY